jgi:hypothetical protein
LAATFTAKLLSPEGVEVAGGELNDSSPPAALYLRLGAGEAWEKALPCYLASRDKDGLSFVIAGFDGANWEVGSVHAGRYTLQIFYDSTQLDDRHTLGGFWAPHFAQGLGIHVGDFWAGQLSSNVVPIEFVEPLGQKAPPKAK